MAYGFTGATHKIRVNTAPVSNEPLTISCLFRLPSYLDGLEHNLGGIWETGSNNGWRIDVRTTRTMRATIKAGGAAASATSSTTVDDSNWHHALAVFASDTDRTIYLDNAGSGTDTNSRSVGTVTRLGIGANDDDTALYSNTGHEVAEFAVYNVSDLTSGERAALARGESPSRVRPGALVFHAELIRSPRDLYGAPLTVTDAAVVAHPRVTGKMNQKLVVPIASGLASVVPILVNQYRARRA